MYSIN
jgi:hypothetical protein